MRTLFLIISIILSVTHLQAQIYKLKVEVFEVLEDGRHVPVQDADVDVEIAGGNAENLPIDDEGERTIYLNEIASDLEAGIEYDVIINKEGYIRFENTFILRKAGELNKQKIELKKFSVDTFYIGGRVLDSISETPIPNLDVEYYDDYKSTTSKNGYFQLAIPKRVINQRGYQFDLSIWDGEEYLTAEPVTIENESDHQSQKKFYINLSGLETPFVIEDIDGNQYETIMIGRRQWLSSNLRTYVSGAVHYPKTRNSQIYGFLYTWEAAKTACQNLGQAWRLPTQEDWSSIMVIFSNNHQSDFTSKGSHRNYTSNKGNKLNLKLGGLMVNNDKLKLTHKEGYYWTASESYRKKIFIRVDKDNNIYFELDDRKINMSCMCVRDSFSDKK